MHLVKALGAQISGWFVAILALRLVETVEPSPWGLLLMQGGFAAATAWWMRAPPWWIPIHLAFSPLIVLALRAQIAPGWYLGIFLLLAAVFWPTFKNRVPLFLTNRATADTLLRILPAGPFRLVDLGCGTGGLLAYLARCRPDARFTGIENAPLPLLVARILARKLPNCEIRAGDLWSEPLGGYDVVYAFLAPPPMGKLGRKAARELPAGAQLVSNSFALPDRAPARTIHGRRGTRTLYVYEFSGTPEKPAKRSSVPPMAVPAAEA